MAPAFFLYIWLPRKCCETRGSPPSLFWSLAYMDWISMELCNDVMIYGVVSRP